MKASPDSKRYVLGAAVSKTQYEYVNSRAKAKGLSVSDYVRGLLARALRAEVAEEKAASAASTETEGEF